LVSFFLPDTRTVIRHGAGHIVPTGPSLVKQYKDFLSQFPVITRPAKEAQEEDKDDKEKQKKEMVDEEKEEKGELEKEMDDVL